MAANTARAGAQKDHCTQMQTTNEAWRGGKKNSRLVAHATMACHRVRLLFVWARADSGRWPRVVQPRCHPLNHVEDCIEAGAPLRVEAEAGVDQCLRPKQNRCANWTHAGVLSSQLVPTRVSGRARLHCSRAERQQTGWQQRRGNPGRPAQQHPPGRPAGSWSGAAGRTVG